MSTFGDIERADTWDADATIAPEQVAYRLHRIRQQIEVLVGRPTVRFRDLSDQDQTRLMHFGELLASQLRTKEPDNPALIAQTIHDILDERKWDALTGDERQIAVDIIDLIVTWLNKEGPR